MTPPPDVEDTTSQFHSLRAFRHFAEFGGRTRTQAHIRVSVEGTDRFGRLLGTVTHEGRDIGEWLVREGHAIAAYSDRYVRVEREAREARRGMWAHSHNFDPRAHRHRKPGKG